MALSAAELQKRHQLEGAPDPFPSLGGAPSPARPTAATKAAGSGSNTPANGTGIDASSTEMFPSLGSSAAAPAPAKAAPALSAWGSKPAIKAGGLKKSTAPGGLGRQGHATAGSHPYTETFAIPANELATGKVVQETMKKVQDQTGAVVESSTQMSTGLKQFHVKASDPKRLALARQIIERGLSKPVTLEVEVPITTIGTIIGPKGATLKSITDATGTKIDIPRRDSLPAWDPREHQNDDDDSDNEDEEPQVTITINGTGAAAKDARDKIYALISHKVGQGSSTIKNIPSKYFPFIAGPRGANARKLEEEVGEGEVKVHVPPPAVWKAIQEDEEEESAESSAPAAVSKELAIKVKGDKEKVKAVVDEIQRQFEGLVDSLKEFGIVVPKRQHRYLIGSAADDILEQTGCIIDLPPASDPNEQVMMRGPQTGLLKAIELAMSKAGSASVEPVDVVAISQVNTPQPFPHAKKVARYLQRSSTLKKIASQYDDVKIYAPRPSAVESTGKVVVEIVGEDKAAVLKARDEVIAAIKAIVPAAIGTVQIDPAVQPLLRGAKGSRIQQFEKEHKVLAIFPPPDHESADVHVVYTGTDVPADKKARDAKLREAISSATSALQALAAKFADVKTETLDVDKKWHRAIIGTGGTVLNALIGEDGFVTVKVGSGKNGTGNEGVSENSVVVRGPADEVDRVVSSIERIVEDAKNDDIVNGFTASFDVEKKYVGQLVGSSGSAINKLREQLGVKVNFDDADKGSKKALVHCTIVGRKEAVAEAQKRLQAQISKLEDEVTEVVKIKPEIQPALIGAGGKYATRLEDKYGVKLSFPHGRDGVRPDEVSIRGGKAGVASAKAELLEAAAFEAESRQEAKFTVPQRAIAFIVGRGGSTINAIKDDTGAQIDIDRSAEDSSDSKSKKDDKVTITVRGDKKAIASAKAQILELVDQFGDEVTVHLTIEPKYHRTLIGQGGQRLRELIASAGGPEDGHKQAGLVTFPKPGHEGAEDQVRLRGDRKVVSKLQAELEKAVQALRNTIVRGVSVPQAQHASRIGRGGSALQDLQRRTGASVHFPGSRQYNTVGEVENASNLADADAADLVKVVGTSDAVAAAEKELTAASNVPERAQRQPRGELSSRTVTIPAKYHYAVADTPNLIRSVRGAGAFLTIPTGPPRPSHSPTPDASGATSARIDAPADEDEEGTFELLENYSNGPEGDEAWQIRAKEEDLDKAESVLQRALEAAKKATHVGLLTGLPRSAFPRIIGSKGATIARLRAETGADISVGKDDDLITITGPEEAVREAREAVVAVVNRRGDRY